MKLALALEKAFFPSSFAVVGLVIMSVFMHSSPFILNDLAVSVLTLALYVCVKRIADSRIKDETKKHTIPAMASMPLFFIMSAFVRIDYILIFAFFSIMAMIVMTHLIRTRWKISAHCLSFSTLATVMSVANPLFIAMFLLLPLVAWCRLKLKRHNLSQVLAGSALGLAMPAIIAFAMGLL